jgi:methanethiol S-methyltransferase
MTDSGRLLRFSLLSGYAALCYTGSLVGLAFAFAWLGGPVGIAVPWRLDQADAGPSAQAISANAVLLALFGLYHSLMARSAVKRRARRFLPRALERATYNLTSSFLTMLLCLLWQPLTPILWAAPSIATAQVIQLAHVCLWVIHLTAIVLMNHNEFFGLRQIGQAMRGLNYRPPPPVSKFYYLCTRLMLVVSLALIPWASPIMTTGRLEFCLLGTSYVILGAWLSNRDHGDNAVVIVSESECTEASP